LRARWRRSDRRCPNFWAAKQQIQLVINWK
jgi:hypothetical protein